MRSVIVNTYFRDDGTGRSFMSGYPLPRGYKGVIRNVTFVGCEFHPDCCGSMFKNCHFVDCWSLGRKMNEYETRP